MGVFKLKEGVAPHVHDNVEYTSGQIIRTTLPLDKLFKNKFENLSAKAAVAHEVEDIPYAVLDSTEIVREAAPKGPSGSKRLKRGGPDLSARGENVTDKFPDAVEHDLQVYKRGNYYHVFVPGSTTPVNEKGIQGKKKTKAFIEDYLEE